MASKNSKMSAANTQECVESYQELITGKYLSELCALFHLLGTLLYSCEPNCRWSFDIKSFSFSLNALRKVRNGEELFVSYCEDDLPYTVRQKKLEQFDFECRCRKCVEEIS